MLTWQVLRGVCGHLVLHWGLDFFWTNGVWPPGILKVDRSVSELGSSFSVIRCTGSWFFGLDDVPTV